MDLLALYSDPKEADFLRLKACLAGTDVHLQALVIPQTWTLSEWPSVSALFQKTSHFVFLLAERDLQNPLVLFACGYCASRPQTWFVWEPQGAALLPISKNLSRAAEADALAERILEENLRWNLELAQERAKRLLADRGFEVTNGAFCEAVEKGDAATVELFLDAGFSCDATSRKGVTLLCLAVRFHHASILRLLVSHGADVNLKSTDRDNTPLMDAAAEGNSELVHELLALGADLKGQSRNGQNALVLAIGKGADAVSQILLKAGADPFAEDKLGMSAYAYAKLFGRADVLSQIAALHPDRV